MNEEPQIAKEEQAQFKRADIGRRAIAFILDHVFFTLVIVSVFFAVFGEDFNNSEAPFQAMSTMATIFLPGFFLYLCKDCMGGISPGKWMVGIMVRDADKTEQVPGIGRLILRNLTLIIWPIEALLLLFSSKHNRIGDSLAHASVFTNPNKPKKFPRLVLGVGIAVFFIIGMVMLVGSLTKNSQAYKLAVQEIEQNERVLTLTGGIDGYGTIPQGKLEVTNGRGHAEWLITVEGKDQDVKVWVVLDKHPIGEWEITEFDLRPID